MSLMAKEKKSKYLIVQNQSTSHLMKILNYHPKHDVYHTNNIDLPSSYNNIIIKSQNTYILEIILFLI